MTDPRIDSNFKLQLIFVGIHFVYFVIYNSKYSSLNHRLTGIRKLETAGVANQESIDISRNSVQLKISKLKKWCYLPVLFIAGVHLVSLLARRSSHKFVQLIVDNKVITQRINSFSATPYWTFGYITLASFLLILAANYIKGAQIIDPNRRFGRYSSWRW